MSKLSELKSSPDVGQASDTVKVCVSAKLAAELDAADKILFEREQAVIDLRAELEEARKPGADAPSRPRRAGESANADLKRRLEEAENAADEAAAVSDAIRERVKYVELTLEAKPGGEWQRWALAHPARSEWVRTGGTEEEPEGEERTIGRDRIYAGGVCDVDALIRDLGGYDEGGQRRPGFVTAYDGEAASDEWWEFVSTNGSPAHLLQAASRVVWLQTQAVDLGKSRVAWRADRRSANSSE